MLSLIQYQWVTTNESLKVVCEAAQQQTVIALDTEFVRTKTYYPQLGLIQMFDGMQVSLIDPLEITDFSPFIALLANQNIKKILHACSEDLEVFWHYFKQLPEPLVDTQVMAAFVGLGQSVGFAKLVTHYLSVELDKGASRTDWLARPLTHEQLQYAAADVWYLLPMYQALALELAQTEWNAAVEQECQFLLQKRRQEILPHIAYKEIANAWKLSPPQLAVLQILAKWRIEEAQKRNLAVNFVVKESSLFEIARLQPRHTSQLLEFMHPNEVRIHGKKLLLLVEQGRMVEREHYPAPIKRMIDEPSYKHALKSMQQKIEEIRPLDLAIELIASKRQLTQLFKWYKKGKNQTQLPELLQGWRADFGKQLLMILEQEK